jgi:hypothetical protein
MRCRAALSWRLPVRLSRYADASYAPDELFGAYDAGRGSRKGSHT